MFQDNFTGFGLLAVVLLLVYLWGVWRWRGRRSAQIDTSKYIIVDGSNVMYWGGDPSFMVLSKVLGSLQENGLTPIVYFDANVGYKLWNRHVYAREIAQMLELDPRQVALSPSGVTADEVLLEQATRDGLRVVSNDRFRDWKLTFPKVGQKGFLVRGRWQQGTVIWQRSLVRKPAVAQ